MEIGLYTFGDITADPVTGRAIGVEQRYREIIEAAKLADEAGFAVFGVGEHHRLDIPISSPAIVMAGIATVTRHIRLASAVTILSTLDPVRVFEDFASVDLLSGGRAEIIAGRGAFIESFPLFGHDLADYDSLFSEKLALLMKLNEAPRVTWNGRHRTPLNDAEISPRPARSALTIWAGTGGNPESAAEAARLGLPLTLANITLPPAKLAPQVADYKRIGVEAGFAPAKLRVSLAGHMHLGETPETARAEFYPSYNAYFQSHVPRPEYVGGVTREEFDRRAGPEGPLFVGSANEIVAKLRTGHELFGHQRYLAQVDIGGLPFAKVARTIELLATKVLPAVKDL